MVRVVPTDTLNVKNDGKKGKRQNHDIVKTEVCVQCEFQVGTRHCFTCRDNYCDSCFDDQHAKGMLQRHDFKRLVPFCEKCNKRAARMIVHDNLPGLPPSRKLCKVCTDDDKPLAPRGTLREDLPYRPFCIDERLAFKESELERKRREAAFEQRKREAQEKVEHIASTDVQRVWRSHRCRVVNSVFVAERRAWLKQRALDDVIRRQLPFKARLLFGVAPPLKSDTVFEKVVKRYPLWCKNMILDVVNNEWQLCYDMIVAQDEHKKTHSLSGPGTHFAQITGLMRAKVNFSLKESVERRKRRESEAAQLAYRNARSSVRGASEEAKAELQQAMRQKKHEHDQLVEQVEEAKEEVKQAAELREAHWGPCGMPKRLKKVRREGWPVRVTVSATHASQFLRVTDDLIDAHQPAVKKGDYLRLAGSPVTYKVIYNSDRPDLGKAFYLGLVRRWVHFAASLEGLDLQQEKDREVIEARTPKFTFDEATTEMLKLDRCWTFEDKKGIVVSKLPRLSPYWKLYYFLTRSIKASSPSQFAVSALAGFHGWVAGKYKSGAALFDDESTVYAWLQRVAHRYDDRRAATRHNLHFLVREQGSSSWLEDFSSLRRTLWRLAKKSRENAMKRRELLAEEARRSKDPLQRWLTSKSQLEVLVMWAPEAEDAEHEQLGYLQVDLDCPAALSRMLLARYLWFDLNKKKGLNFFFQLDKEDTLRVEKEAATKLDTLVQNRLNQETKSVEYVLTLAPDPDNGAVMEVEPFDWEEQDSIELALKTNAKKPEEGDDEDDDELVLVNIAAQKVRYTAELLQIREAQQAATTGAEIGSAKLEEPSGFDAADILGSFDEDAEMGSGVDAQGGDTPAIEEETWSSYVDDSGYSYWYNEFTGESTYDQPPGVAAVAANAGYDPADFEEDVLT